ncbi:hypothetical protein ACN077_03185 [Clostridium chromiireducens]|uniref:hypothetical protein n=1 Tax=Clostridium chromiireducens TaxID=225345 RepID=UPI003AF5F2EC
MNDNMVNIVRWSNIEADIKVLGIGILEKDLDFQILINQFRSELITLLAFKLNFNFYNEDTFKTARSSLYTCINKLNEKYCTKEEKQSLSELVTFLEDIFEEEISKWIKS